MNILNKFRAWKPEHRAMSVDFPNAHKLAEVSVKDKNSAHPVIGFYTKDPIYEGEAKRMTASACRLGLEVLTTPVTGTGDWVRNASMKAQFLAEQRTVLSGPLLYVDVDAVFHRDPWSYLNSLDCDMAVYYEASGHLLAGTIFIADTQAAQELLNEWMARCNANPDIWDQVVLEEIIAEDAASLKPKFRISILPVSFCWIFDKLDNNSVDEVYIEQLQASRETKKKRKLFGRVSSNLKRRRERTAEIERILFQSK